jgi:uncharacterized membrane protein (UPF0127 family)
MKRFGAAIRSLLLAIATLLMACDSTANPGQGSVPTASSGTPGPVVQVGRTAFLVELAVTASERSQGLSDRPQLDHRRGMLFIYDQEGRYQFWMKGMRFPLDMVWISAQCTVVDITRNAPVPAPGQTLEDLPRYAPQAPARYVLEINAGEAASTGIEIESRVHFAGSLAGLHGC